MKTVFRVLAILLLLAGRAFAAASIDDPNVIYNTFGAVADVTFDVTTSGSNRALSCGVTYNGNSPATVTYNSVSMLSAGAVTVGSSRNAEAFVLSNPATSTNSLFAAPGSGNMEGVVGCVPMIGGHQTTASLAGTAATDSNSGGTDLTANVTVTSGGLSLSYGVQYLATVCTGVTATGSGQTELYDVCNPDDSYGGFASSNFTSGTATHTYTLTANGGYIAMVVIPINAAAAVDNRRFISAD